jgi:hypothetical protein
LAAFHLAAAVVEGLNPADRTAPIVQAEAFTLFQRAARVGDDGGVRSAKYRAAIIMVVLQLNGLLDGSTH